MRKENKYIDCVAVIRGRSCCNIYKASSKMSTPWNDDFCDKALIHFYDTDHYPEIDNEEDLFLTNDQWKVAIEKEVKMIFKLNLGIQRKQ